MSHGTEYLLEYMRLVPAMDRAEFVRSFPHPFLVQAKPVAGRGHEPFQFTTTRFRRDDALVSTGQMLRLQGQAQVIQVFKRGENVFTDMISVGRALNNDVVLPYTSVSKFHAFFRKAGEDGPYTLTDADATNRTLVNDAALKPERPRELADGDIISFSHKFVFTFHSPGGFYDFVKKLLQEVVQAELDGLTSTDKKEPGRPDR